MLSRDTKQMVETMIASGYTNSGIAQRLGVTLRQVCGVRYRKKNGHAITASERMRQTWADNRPKMMAGVHKSAAIRHERAERSRRMKAHWSDPDTKAKHLAALEAGRRARYAPQPKPSIIRRILSALSL